MVAGWPVARPRTTCTTHHPQPRAPDRACRARSRHLSLRVASVVERCSSVSKQSGVVSCYRILSCIVLLTLCTYLLVILHFAKCMTRLYVSFGFHEKRTNRAVYNSLYPVHMMLVAPEMAHELQLPPLLRHSQSRPPEL